MKKLILNSITIFFFSICIIACSKSTKANILGDEKPITDSVITDKNSDSIALLKLTKNLFDWEENKSKTEDFPIFQKNETDTVYSGIDFHQLKLRL